MNNIQNDIFWVVVHSPINYIISFILIIFFIIVYFYFFHEEKIESKEEVKKEKPKKRQIKQEKDFNIIIKNIEENHLEDPKDFFYKELSYILKEILEEKWYKKIWTMTFDEINNIKIWDELKNLIKQLYYKEYSKFINDNLEIRKKYINEIKKLIK